MRERGFEPQCLEIDTTAWKPGFFNDWTPTESDKDIVRERIKLRISQKPNWYRYKGKPLQEAINQ